MKPFPMTSAMLTILTDAQVMFTNKGHELLYSSEYKLDNEVGKCVRTAAEQAFQSADILCGALKRYEE